MSASGLATFQAPKTLSIFKKTDQHFYNLYFFRNMISNQVLISKTFQFDNEKGAKQLRMNRNQLKLRKDHFVSFMVLTGIKSTEIQGTFWGFWIRGYFYSGICQSFSASITSASITSTSITSASITSTSITSTSITGTSITSTSITSASY